LIILGDRYETFAICQAAFLARIPIGHIHGGELTFGAIDDAFRHAITKMAHLHFTSTEGYRKRVIQLGEEPDRVFCVGAPAIDAINSSLISDTEELSRILDLDLNRPYYVLTYHPVTLSQDSGLLGLENLLQILRSQNTHNVVITAPNVDSSYTKIEKMIINFASENKKTRKIHSSLGRKNYYKLIANCDAVLGNSSSGLIEAPSFCVPTINIGKRQQGRVVGETVITVNEAIEDISAGFRRLSKPEFRERLRVAINPYGQGGASKEIANIMQKIDIKNMKNKHFHDITSCEDQN